MALSLWLHLGSHLLLQLEAFLQAILLRLAQGTRTSASQHQEAALEVHMKPSLSQIYQHYRLADMLLGKARHS